MVIINSKCDTELVKQELNDLINFLGENLEMLNKITTKRDKKINAIKEEAAQATIKQRNLVEKIGREIYKLFKANKASLTDNGRNKILELELGKIGTRFNRTSVWAKNIKQLNRNFNTPALIRFIKIKKEYSLNKIAIAAEPEVFKGMEGISITQKEVFFIQPTVVKEEYRKEIKKVRLN